MKTRAQRYFEKELKKFVNDRRNAEAIEELNEALNILHYYPEGSFAYEDPYIKKLSRFSKMASGEFKDRVILDDINSNISVIADKYGLPLKSSVDRLFIILNDAIADGYYYPTHDDEDDIRTAADGMSMATDDLFVIEYVTCNCDRVANGLQRFTLGEFIRFRISCDYEPWFRTTPYAWKLNLYEWRKHMRSVLCNLDSDYRLVVDYEMTLNYLRFYTRTTYRVKTCKNIIIKLRERLDRVEQRLFMLEHRIYNVTESAYTSY